MAVVVAVGITIFPLSMRGTSVRAIIVLLPLCSNPNNNGCVYVCVCRNPHNLLHLVVTCFPWIMTANSIGIPVPCVPLPTFAFEIILLAPTCTSSLPTSLSRLVSALHSINLAIVRCLTAVSVFYEFHYLLEKIASCY